MKKKFICRQCGKIFISQEGVEIDPKDIFFCNGDCLDNFVFFHTILGSLFKEKLNEVDDDN